MLIVPALARADATCDNVFAQNLVRQGYSYLDEHRWQDARIAAGQLAMYAKGCDDPKVGYPSVVYSAYIGGAAFHGLGDDARAQQALGAGMVVIDILKKDGGYPSLVNAMEPKFQSLGRELRPSAPQGAQAQ
jgi:hypothetical protein